ncbi:WXG100 family type VII secretion target [Mobilisporobacter senegalensis]|uniref:WXG100 family type VII secretion target n=1 Tax=Mobilisporobacter senegalensis TaxID=1329262 RepID=A0A3N1XZQ5_9FIRM|nr:WXG100 family type VII secretion target [Mobilisporobacter senegalensis]ROR31758.1 WXG100 family type VII secretion target [Mobilisporobacter senegalensis]
MIAYEGNNSFCYETEVFAQASKAFNDSAATLKEMKDNLVTRIDDLRNIGWKSDAGNSFFEIIDHNWSNDIERYVDLMEDLSTMITYAIQQFESVSEQAKSIKYEENLSRLSDIPSEKVGAKSLRTKY